MATDVAIGGARKVSLLSSVRAGALFWGAVAAIVFAAYYIGLKQFHPTLWPGSYEYSQVARSIASGRGIVTGSGSVLEYWFLHSAGLPLPYFYHDIGNSLLMALFFKILGAREQVIGLMSGAFLILTAPLTFLFGSRLYGRKVAAVATALVVVNAELLIYATTGHSEVPFAFFLTLFLFLLYRFRSGWGLFAAGLVFGWLIVLRSNALPFLPWVLLFILFDPSEASGAAFGIREKWVELRQEWRSRAARLALFLVGMLVLFVPNAVRNYVYMHSPLYNVNSVYSLVWYTSAISGKSQEIFSQPGLNVDPLRFIATHPAELVNKMQYQLSRTADHLLTGVIYPDNWQDAFIILLFVLSLIAPYKGESQRQQVFRWLVVILILTALIVGSVLNIRWRH
ncbi:MAG: glycosyltransferase family 39 protein, partial [Rudaea sp.]